MDAVYFTCQPCLLRSDTFYWQRLLLAKKKENYRNKSSSRFCRTYKYTNRWHACKHKSPLFLLTRKPTNTLLPYTNKITHTEVWKDHAYLGWSMFTWRPEGAVNAHKSGYFACMWEPAKHFSLLSVILIAQHDSSAPNLPAPPHCNIPPARWLFFFFLTVCGLLHLCSTTLNPWDGWVEWKVWSSAWTNGLEVAEQIKRIKRSLFTDTSKLFWRWAMDPPTHTHLLQHPNNSPPRQKSDTHKDISTASRSCACAYITHHQYTV